MRLAIAIVLLLLVGCHSRPLVEKRGTDTGGVRQPSLSNEIVAPGIAEPWEGEVRIGAREQGMITEVLVREGEVVVKGQVLVRVDETAQIQAVLLARSELAEAAASLLRLRRGATPDDVALARAEREVAGTRAEQAGREAGRARALGAVGTVSAADAEHSAADAKSAGASLAAASARLRIVERGTRPEDLQIAEARVAAARARVAAADEALLRRQVVAPSAGTVLWSRAHPGELFLPGESPLLVMGDLRRAQVRAEVDELDASEVGDAAPCALFSDVGRRVAECKVTRRSPMFGRRALGVERSSTRTDIHIQEIFVEVLGATIAPGQRLWVHLPRAPSKEP